MFFNISDDARKANERSLGVKYSEMERIPMDKLDETIPKGRCESARQVSPRGSVYLQLGRKGNIKLLEKIIKSF